MTDSLLMITIAVVIAKGLLCLGVSARTGLMVRIVRMAAVSACARRGELLCVVARHLTGAARHG